MEILEGITEINKNTNTCSTGFEVAKKLEEIKLPTTMSVLGKYTFKNASSLTTVEGFEEFLAREGSSIQAEAFYGASAWGEGITVTLPEGMTTIGNHTFASTKIVGAVIPDSVTVIYNHVF